MVFFLGHNFNIYCGHVIETSPVNGISVVSSPQAHGRKWSCDDSAKDFVFVCPD